MNAKFSDGRPPELLKSVSNRLASALMSPDQQDLAGMLQLTGLLGCRAPSPRVADNAMAAGDYENAERVGIWERQSENGKSHFIRSLSAVDDWLLWANIPRIEEKGTKLRVVLIGESVARGYLYEPEFTPALALSMIFDAHFGKDKVEVIDLARTNLGFGLRELALEALALKPDAVIIFSGNNWRCPVCPDEIRAEVHESLCCGGFPAMKRLGMEWLTQRVRGLVRDISSAYRARGISLIWVVPEFNLGDWRIPPMNAPHLADGGNKEWLLLLDASNEALAKGELDLSTELARKAADLDQGTSVAAWQIMAECSLRRNDFASARSQLESARDAVQWYAAWSISPGVISLVQQILREEAVGSGDLLVDSPRLFADLLGGRLPGRQIFLDYCHLTVEGIRVTMAAAASQALRAIKGVALPWQELASAVISPSPKVDGEAAFLAAVHNAHWWQSAELIRHYCSKSIHLAPHMAEIMLAFLEVQTRRAPMLMCAVAGKIAEAQSALLRHYLLHYNRQQLDYVLLDAIVSALKKVGINAQQKLERLRREEHTFMDEDANLLDDYYYSSSLPLQEAIGLVMRREGTLASANNQDNLHYKAYWRESRFAFVGERECPAKLQITCRLPHLSEGAIRLVINGHCETELFCAGAWTAWEINIHGRHVVDGVNEITVHWPMPDFPGAKAFSTIVADFGEHLFPEFLCLFGEIQSLRVSRPLAAAELTRGRPEESEERVQPVPRSPLRRRIGVPVASSQ